MEEENRPAGSDMNNPGDHQHPSDARYLVGTSDGMILSGEEGPRWFPVLPESGVTGSPIELAVQGNTRWYIIQHNPEEPVSGEYSLVPLRELLATLPAKETGLLSKGIQLLRHHEMNGFCGRCGTRTRHHQSERALWCPGCDNLVFPRLSPAIIVRITDGDRILLARSPRFIPGMYSVIAGFVEPGETLEETVRREVMEEVGIGIDEIRYFGSQPWPFPDSLMIAFTAVYSSGEIRPDKVEIEDARWFTRSDLPALPSSASIARRLIDEYLSADPGR